MAYIAKEEAERLHNAHTNTHTHTHTYLEVTYVAKEEAERLYNKPHREQQRRQHPVCCVDLEIVLLFRVYLGLRVLFRVEALRV